jgi:hypothetical protein
MATTLLSTTTVLRETLSLVEAVLKDAETGMMLSGPTLNKALAIKGTLVPEGFGRARRENTNRHRYEGDAYDVADA